MQRSGGIIAALLLMGQWSALHFTSEVGPIEIALSAGFGIFGAAFALTWAAEVAQLDIPAALSIAFLALIAVLPEYAIDIYFAWQAGQDPTYVQYAAANMTGANRILIGLGWPVVVFAYAWRSGARAITLERQQGTEVLFLLMATAYSFVIPLKGTLSPLDSGVLVLLFAAYMYAVARGEVEEPHLEGSAELIASLSRPMRRAVTFGLFVVAGFTIFIASEPFAEALLDIGQEFGVDQFLLVQWLAPLASESPEFIVAILFSLRLKPTIAFSALLSSKVNQWTLLIGMLPLAYSASRGGLLGMVLEERQAREILLTSAQSLFAIVILADMRFGIREALALLVLFSIQLAWPEPIVRDAFIWIYCGLSLVMLVVRPQTRASLYRLVRTNPFR